MYLEEEDKVEDKEEEEWVDLTVISTMTGMQTEDDLRETGMIVKMSIMTMLVLLPILPAALPGSVHLATGPAAGLWEAGVRLV